MSSDCREPTPHLKAHLADFGLSEYEAEFRRLKLGSIQKLSIIPTWDSVETLIEKGIKIKTDSVDGIKMLTMFNRIFCDHDHAANNRNYRINVITPEPSHVLPIKEEKAFAKIKEDVYVSKRLLIEGMSEMSEEEEEEEEEKEQVIKYECNSNSNHNTNCVTLNYSEHINDNPIPDNSASNTSQSAINMDIESVSAVAVREQSDDHESEPDIPIIENASVSLQKKIKKRAYIIWDKFHEKKLRSLRGEYANDWEKIAAQISDEFGIKRTAIACRQKWNKIACRTKWKPRTYYERQTKNDIEYGNTNKKKRKRRTGKRINYNMADKVIGESENEFDATAKPKSFSIHRIPLSKKQRL